MVKARSNTTRARLSETFVGFAAKRLTATEVDPETSHGHELQGVQELRTLLGDAERRDAPAEFYYLSDRHAEGPVRVSSTVTWYDSRRNQPHRKPEYRLYYPAGLTLLEEYAEPGDLAVIALDRNNVIHVFIAEEGSSYESKLAWLICADESATGQKHFTAWSTDERDRVIGLTVLQVLEEIGVEPRGAPFVTPDFLPELIENFGYTFPSTRQFSEYARSTLPDITPLDDPDGAIVAWMEREELLFRTFENHLVGKRIAEGFSSVDVFVDYSLSVHQRRKSRAGLALENHFEQLLKEAGIRYQRGVLTERRSRPDFLFPGQAQYQDPAFPAEALTMLGVKSTCKDRWRQILAEADRIPTKHLLTLEPGVSRNQTAEMAANNVVLVVPRPLHETYHEEQRRELFTVRAFLELVNERQQSIDQSS